MAMDDSSVASDDDYDVISNPGLESSLPDLTSPNGGIGHNPSATLLYSVHEVLPSQDAKERFSTVSLTGEDIAQYVKKALEGGPRTKESDNATLRRKPPQPFVEVTNSTVRVYVDGTFDMFNAGHALQLRQAKLSFPSVYLMVGVFSDDLCTSYNSTTRVPHVERCEVLRHCRWVDEVIPTAPWAVTEDMFMSKRRIDYVALDEGMSVDPSCDKVRLKAYDGLKSLGRIIPTRRTIGLSRVTLPVARNETSSEEALPIPPPRNAAKSLNEDLEDECPDPLGLFS